MSHLSPETLGALKDGALSDGARGAAERHLETCARCREALAALEALERELAGALEHDPGEHYFESFADRVSERIRAEQSSRRAVAPTRGGWRELFAPRGLAWAGSLAAVAVVAVLVYFQSQGPRSYLAQQAAREQAAPPPKAEPDMAAKKEFAADDQIAQQKAADELKRDASSNAAPAPSSLDLRELNAPPAESGPSGDAEDGFASAPAPPQDERWRDKAQTGAPSAKALSAPAPSPTAQRQTVPQSGGAREERIAGADRGAVAPAAPSMGITSNEAATRTDTYSALKARAVGPLQKQSESAKTKASASGTLGYVADGLQPPPRWPLGAWPASLRPLAASADSAARVAWSGSIGTAKDVMEKANAHEATARAWDRVRAAASPRSAAEAEARLRVAEEQYAAWTVDHSATRAAAARTALKSASELASPETKANYLTPLLTMLP